MNTRTRFTILIATTRLAVGRLSLLCFFVIATVAPVVAQMPPTVDTEIGRGIGTAVDDVFGDGTNVAVRTSIASVTYGKPRKVRDHGVVYFELLGSVEGVGWGGEVDTLGGPGPTFDAETHYDYDVPFVLRWPRAFDGTLVYYAHGYPNLGLELLGESVLGDENESRRIDELESRYVSDGALARERGHAIFSANLGGLRRDGSFSAVALEGPFAGQPLNLSIDAPIARDLAQLSKRLVERFAGRAVDRTIGAGHSGGAAVMQFVAGGVTTPIFEGPHAGTPLFTGGNFVTPYDAASGLVFDGVIAIAPGDALVHPEFPATVPVIQLGGNADYSGVNMVRYASRLVRAGVDVDRVLRVYQVADLPHNFAEITEYSPKLNRVIGDVIGLEPSTDGERLAPVVAAAIDAVKVWIANGTEPPPSRLAGRAVDTDGDGAVDAVEFDQAGGASTRLFPFVEDPSIDTFEGEQFDLSVAGGFPGTVARYAEVLDALDHVSGSLDLPYVECRLGGYAFGPLGDARLVPFADLGARWPTFKSYRSSIRAAVSALAAERLYDERLGRRSVFTAEIRGLFGRNATNQGSLLVRRDNSAYDVVPFTHFEDS